MVCLLGFLLKWGHDGSQHRIVEKTMQKHLCKWGVFRFMPRDQHLCMTIHSSEREERVFFEATPVKESFKINTKKLHRKVTKVTMIYHLHSCREIKDYRFLFDRCGTCKQGALHFMTFLESACHLWYWIIKWSIIVLRTAIRLCCLWFWLFLWGLQRKVAFSNKPKLPLTDVIVKTSRSQNKRVNATAVRLQRSPSSMNPPTSYRFQYGR